MTSGPARKHHYVPRFILRPWAIHGELNGYYWDNFCQEIRVRKLGVGAFCRELDLLSLETSVIPSDALETEFFGRIDDLGAKVVTKLVKRGPHILNAEERVDFARLLLSLDVRRPNTVKNIKEVGTRHFVGELDRDPEILEALAQQGIDKKPSEVWRDIGDASLTDHALLLVQKLVDNQNVGSVLINAHWRVYRLGRGDGTFVLSDRPLVRLNGFDQPNAVWAVPLSPSTLFVAANSVSVVENIDRKKPLQIRKRMNVSSLNQVDRFAFMIDDSNLPLLRTRLRKLNH